MKSNNLRIMGVDFGHRRLGIALSDEGRIIASPKTKIDRNGKEMESIKKLIEANEVGLIVMGLPIRLDGTEGREAQNVRKFAGQLRIATGLAVEFADERFTTSEAEQVLISNNVRRKARRDVIDAMAAALMLQGYLDRLK